MGKLAYFVILVSVVIIYLHGEARAFEFKHHDNKELLKVLENVHQTCPNITRIYTLSESSVMGVPLYIIEFSTNPGQHEPLKPEFKYIGNMHGNEVLGRELLLKLAHYLCEGYLAHDEVVHKLITKTRIHLLPSMNPDGWQVSTDQGGTDYLLGRANANGVDLNRDFPDLDRIMFGNEAYHINNNNHLMDQIQKLDHPVQPETLAVMRLIMSTPFVLSANMHGGDLVANYPYDASRSGASSEYTETPDDRTFRYLAMLYSRSHATMADPKRPSCDLMDNVSFGKTGGITNGAKWYSVRGGMQDFNYLSSNDFEVTLELGCKKYPRAAELQGEWEQNKNALLNFMWGTHVGVKGLVRDSITGRPIANALIQVQNITQVNGTHSVFYRIEHDIMSVFAGDYYRLLTPGQYLITASYPGYKLQTRRVKVTNPKYHEATILHFWLEPAAIGESEPQPHPAAKYNIHYNNIPEQFVLAPEILDELDEVADGDSSLADFPVRPDELGEDSTKDWLAKYMYQQVVNM